MARSFSDSNAIRYVLPVLWMTSCFIKVHPFSLFLCRNVRWPCGMNHGEYADGSDRQTDGRTPDRYITLSAMDAANVIM